MNDSNVIPVQIMVIDDNPALIALIETIFYTNNFKIIPAYSGPEALTILKTVTPDIIMLDLMMPGMDGFDVCKAIKADENTQSIPIIILSAKREVNDKVQGLSLGADDFLTKPFHPEELKVRINVMLRIKRLELLALEKERLEAALKTAISLSHEINNPLASVVGCADVIRTMTDNAEISKNLDTIISQSKDISGILAKLSNIKKFVDTDYVDGIRMLDIDKSALSD